MDKPTERQPLDDFFRRNLNRASVPPSIEGWTRLEERLAGQQLIAADKPDRRIGAAWYWSASAAAACLLVVFLWVDRENGSALETKKPDLAATTLPGKKVVKKSARGEKNSLASETEELATVTTLTTKAEPGVNPQNRLSKKEWGGDTNGSAKLTIEPKLKIEQPSLIAQIVEKQPEKIQSQSASERTNAVAATSGETTTKSTLTHPERILIVSVVGPAPETLPADAMPTQAASSIVAKDTPVKNPRITNVFRQIKRLKDGEVLARADVNPSEADDEGGLFNRLVRSARSKENQIKQQK